MATHDYDIANQSGANFRTDLNNCLDAIVSNNSNASDPSTTFAYMWWVDTSNNVLKLRNSANNAWITLPMSITASNTITPTLNMGAGAEEDVKIVFDGNAKDFYIALDDSADKLVIGEGSTVGTNSIVTITDDSVTIGDGAAVDTKIVFDGNAQDYYLGLDDSADKLIIGVGSAVGTTPAISIDSSQNFEIAGTMNLFGFKGSVANFTNSMLISQDAGTGTLSSAVSNTGFGHNVFNVLTSGRFNTGMGQETLKSLTTGDSNTGIGSDCLAQLTEGDRNTAYGATSLDAVTTGSQNTAVGYGALSGCTTASENTAIGDSALELCSTGTRNVAVGEDALKSVTTVTNCTAVGHSALESSTGSEVVALGYNAGGNNTSGGTNIFIGAGAGTASEVNDTESDSIYIGNHTGGNNGTNSEYVFGHGVRAIGGTAITIGAGTGNNRIYNFYASNATWHHVSDERYKEEIKDNTDCGLDFINDLRPVTFKWKPKSNIDETLPDYDANKTTREYDKKMYGLIAQEVKDALDKNNITDFGGWHEEESSGIQGISGEMFIHPLINAVQELSAKCDSLQNEINELKGT